MKFLRYSDLVERGLFRSRMTLKRAIDEGRFPPGRLLTPNARAWTEEEADHYVDGCPTSRKTDSRPKSVPSADLRNALQLTEAK
jgi:predicted DNA-binding transcriptional regulator AlpA